MMHAKGVGKSEFQVVVDTPLASFGNRGMVYQLSSSFYDFPWVDLSNRILTEVELPLSMEGWQMDMAWDCLLEVKEVIQQVRIQKSILKNPFSPALMWNDNAFSAESILAMTGLFAIHPGITALDLRRSMLTHKEAAALSPALCQMPELKTLHLAINQLGHQGINALSEAFRRMTVLQVGSKRV
jgi:hypothetical protein